MAHTDGELKPSISDKRQKKLSSCNSTTQIDHGTFHCRTLGLEQHQERKN